MATPALFNCLLGERVRWLVRADGRSMGEISLDAGLGEHAVARLIRGHPVRSDTLFAILTELHVDTDALAEMLADFNKCKRQSNNERT